MVLVENFIKYINFKVEYIGEISRLYSEKCGLLKSNHYTSL